MKIKKKYLIILKHVYIFSGRLKVFFKRRSEGRHGLELVFRKSKDRGISSLD